MFQNLIDTLYVYNFLGFYMKTTVYVYIRLHLSSHQWIKACHKSGYFSARNYNKRQKIQLASKIQWVTKKNTSSCIWNLCFSHISPESLELQKSYMHLFTSLTEKLSDGTRIVQIWSQNQLVFAKTLICQKKVSYWKKSAILKNS